ncbi:hypothetical protein [Candidatus Nanohalococcus occultus]|uniref:hypothetical protein n=1 Tax=Candidatus Nanohalococcus occultus TaxID=2978047 RepID=UPI0039E1DEC3
MKKISVVFLTAALILFAGSATAQFDSPGSGIGDVFDGFFQDINQQIDWYNGNSFGSFLIWVALPFVGIYAIFRFLFHKAFAFGEENFRQNSGYGDEGLSDIGNTMSRLVAISVSTVTLVVWGGILGWILVAAGIGGSLWFTWGLISSIAGTTSPLPFGDWLNPTRERIEDAVSQSQAAENDIEQAEAEEQDADQNDNDAEARDAEQKLERAIQEIEAAIDDLRVVGDKDKQEIKDIIERAKAADVSEGLGPEKNFEQKLDALLTNLGDMTSGVGTGMSADDIEHNLSYYNSGDDNYAKLAQDIRQIDSDLQAFMEAESKAESTMENELRELIDVIKDFERVDKLLEKLDKEVMMATEAESFEEDLAQRLGDEDLYQRSRRTEAEVRQAGEFLKGLESLKQDLRQDLHTATNLFQKQLNLEESEIEELERIREDLIPDLRDAKEQLVEEIRRSDIKPASGGKAEELWAVVDAVDPNQLEEKITGVLHRMKQEEKGLSSRFNDVVNNLLD